MCRSCFLFTLQVLMLDSYLFCVVMKSPLALKQQTCWRPDTSQHAVFTELIIGATCEHTCADSRIWCAVETSKWLWALSHPVFDLDASRLLLCRIAVLERERRADSWTKFGKINPIVLDDPSPTLASYVGVNQGGVPVKAASEVGYGSQY